MSITYSAGTNVMSLMTGLGNFQLTTCASRLRAPAVGPHGSYCGGISGIFSIKIDATNATTFSAVATVFGTPYSCPSEAWQVFFLSLSLSALVLALMPSLLLYLFLPCFPSSSCSKFRLCF